MIPLLLLTLTLVAILAYLMGYHDGHYRGFTRATVEFTNEMDETLNLLRDKRRELDELKFDHANLLANHKYLLWERGAGQSEGSIQ